MINSNSANGLATEIAGAQACTPENRILEHLNSSARLHEGKSRELNQQLVNEIRQKTNGGMVTLSPVLSVALDFLREVRSSDWNSAVRCLVKDLDAYQQVIGGFLPQLLIEQAEQQIRRNAYDKGSNSNAALDLPEFFSRFERQGSTTTHFPSGICRLDQSLNGGVSGLTFLLGDKGVGKTSLLLSCIMNTLNDPEACVLFYSLDMLKDDILSRICCRELGTPRRKLRPNFFSDPQNKQVIDDVTIKLRRLKIVESDFSVSRDEYDDTILRNGMSHRSVLDEAIKLQRESGASKLLIVVDLFQKIITSSSVAVSEGDTYRLDVFNQLTSSLRRYFGGRQFAFLVTSEMRKRDGKKSGNRPTLDDMKGDGRIASDADAVLILSPNGEINKSTNLVCLDIAKGREGVIRGKHELTFHHLIGRFEGSRETTLSTDNSTAETTYDE